MRVAGTLKAATERAADGQDMPCSDLDSIVPHPSLAAVFRVLSSLWHACEAISHDRVRCLRLVKRIQCLALELNTSVIAVAAAASVTASTTPNSSRTLDDPFSPIALLPQRPHTLQSTLTSSPVQSPTTPSKRMSFIGAIAEYVAGTTSPSGAASPTAVQLNQPPAAGRRWRSSTAPPFSSLLFPSRLWDPHSGDENGGKSTKVLQLPPHRRPEAFLSMVERVKSFLLAASARDGVRVVVGRYNFEIVLNELRGIVRSWAEEVGTGMDDQAKWDEVDQEDDAEDYREYNSALAELITAVTGSISPTPPSVISSASAADSGLETDDEPFNVLSELAIPQHSLVEAEEVIARRLADIERQEVEDALTSVTFGDSSEASTSAAQQMSLHCSKFSTLERRWMEVVLSALQRENINWRLDRDKEQLESYQAVLWRVVNSYDLDEDGDGLPLAASGFGESKRAVLDSRPPIAVVIKRLRLQGQRMTTDLKSTFVKEVERWCKLKSEFVVPVYGASSPHSSYPFIITPYLRNSDLLTYTRSHPGHSLRLLHEAALGMAYLHCSNVIHGSLRASNILVSDEGHAQITDIGLLNLRSESFMANSNFTRSGWIRWTAPEILRGGQLRKPADVYSFAMTIYELVAGRQPFQGLISDSGYDESEDDEDDEVRRRVIHDCERPTRPSCCPDLLWELICCCWSQDELLRLDFEAVHARLRVLLRMQAAFRRQSQIKSRSEAFIINVPLDDLTPPHLLNMNGNAGYSATPIISSASSGDGCSVGSRNFSASSTIDEEVDTSSSSSSRRRRTTSCVSEVGDSAYGPSPRSSVINLNLSFSLDGLVGPPHPSTVMKFGIDLPPRVGSEGEDEELSEDPLSVDSDTVERDPITWSLWLMFVHKDSEHQTAHLESHRAVEDSPMSLPWNVVASTLRDRMPTLLCSPTLKLILDPDSTGRVSYRTLHEFVNSACSQLLPQLSPTERESLLTTSTHQELLHTAFARFCMTINLDPSSALLDVARLRETLTLRGASSGGGGLAIDESPATVASPALSLLHMVAKCTPGTVDDFLDVLMDHRVIKENNLDLEGLDGKGWSVIHHATKAAGGIGECGVRCRTMNVDGEIQKISLTLTQPLRGDSGNTCLCPVVRLISAAPNLVRVASAKTNWTALHVAAWVGSGIAVDALVAANADPFAKDANGWTPLAHAVRYNRINVVRSLLCAMKATIGMTDEWEDQRVKCLDIAKSQGHDDCGSILAST